MNLKSAGVAIALAVAVVGGTAWAAATIASIVAPDGSINGCYATKNGALRIVEQGEACGKRELAVQWNQTGAKGNPGATGPAGPQGVPGPKGDTGPQGLQGEPGPTSLEGIECDTGSLDKPDGRTTVTVADNGAITLECESMSTNPVLSVALATGPQVCVSFPVSFCFLSRFGAAEVDATGAPVTNGFECNAGSPNQSTFPGLCQTQRFAPGATVRLAAAGTFSGLVPSWTGCDSVDAAAVCTVAMTGARSVVVQPVTG